MKYEHRPYLLCDPICSALLVCIVAPFICGFFWKGASTFGAWAAIIVGGVTWLGCYILKTELDSTIYGFVASCIAMVGGSLLKPDAEKVEQGIAEIN